MHVKVYGTAYCGYCRRAEELLHRQGIPFDYIDVTHDAGTRDWLVDRANGRRTVPVIFFGDVVVGGYQELAGLSSSGELDRRLVASAPKNDNADAPVITKTPRAA